MATKQVLKERPSTPFGPPYDDDDADAILRSSDQVDFYVYRVILSKSSPFFKSMFSLPRPEASTSEKRPVINLTENSNTIDILLAFIYPVETEPISLDDMIGVLSAARKYDMAAVSQRLTEKFAESKVVQDSSVEAFCVAYSHELGDAARIAAKASLKHRLRLDDIGDKLQSNGPSLHHLWKFHRACSTTAAEAIAGTHLIWLDTVTEPRRTWWDFLRNNRRLSTCKCRRYEYRVGPEGSSYWFATTGWHNYITRAHDVLLQHPCAEAVARRPVYEPSYDEEMCSHCQSSLFGLPEFIRFLGEEVERRVSTVALELPF